MKKMKRLLLFVTSVVLAFGLTSCSGIGRDFDLFRNDEAITDEYCEEIIDALENQDTDKLKSMFSTSALAEAENIDEGLAYVMDIFQGETTLIDGGRSTSESVDHGEKTIEFNALYSVTTDENEYYIYFIYRYEDTKNPDNIGLYMLKMVKQSEVDAETDWVGKPYIAGIWYPDETA